MWQAASAAGWVSETLLPSPLAVLRTTWDSTRSGELPANMWVSFGRAVADSNQQILPFRHQGTSTAIPG